MKTQHYIIIAALAVAAYIWWDKLKAAVLLTPGTPAPQVGTPANNQIAVGEPNGNGNANANVNANTTAPIPAHANWIPSQGEIAATNPSMFV